MWEISGTKEQVLLESGGFLLIILIFIEDFTFDNSFKWLGRSQR